MATIANQFDPNNPNANSNTGDGGTVMPASSGGSASVASGSGSGNTSTPSSSATPYQAPNVSQYLAANQGAGQQLTQGITNNVQNQANQVNNQINSSQNQLNSQYQPLNSNLNTGTANQVAQTAFQNPQQLLDAYNAAKTQSSSQPLSSDQQNQANQYNQFQQLNNGGYNQAIQNYGNTANQDAGQIQTQLANLNQQTGSAANEMGRNQLLQNAVGQGNYNQGEQTLDALFLQGAPGQTNTNGLSNLQQLQQNLGNIGNQANQNYQTASANTQNQLAALQGLSAGDQSMIKNLFLNGGASGPQGLNQIGTSVAGQYGAAQAQQTDAQAIQTALQNNKLGSLTPQQISELGLQPGQQTWGATLGGAGAGSLALNPLAAQGTTQANAQTATADQFARYNALNQLAGGANGAQPSIFGSATQAGYTPFSFNTPEAQAAIAAKQNTVNNTDYNNYINQSLTNLKNAIPTYGASFGSAPGSSASSGNNTIGNLYQTLQGAGNATTAQSDINNFLNYVKANQNPIFAGQTVGEINSVLSPFENYYNNEYTPAAAAKIGIPTPSNTPGS